MSNPKIRPCPRCQSDEHMNVYAYDSGSRHVECDKCFYLGPAEGSVKAAIKSHNAKVASPAEGKIA